MFLKITKKNQGLGFEHGLVRDLVNIYIDMNMMVLVSPRRASDIHVITIVLERKRCYKYMAGKNESTYFQCEKKQNT